MKSARFAVCVHVYYLDVWRDIQECIGRFSERVDVYITCRPEIEDEVRASVRGELQASTILVIEDAGMDVLPFLKACRAERLDRYTAILKLHTKNRKSERSTFHGRMMLEALCGSLGIINSVTDVFNADQNAGMVGAGFQVRSARALMYGNGAVVEDILRSLDVGLEDWSFLAGTMFWISGRLLSPLIENLDGIMKCGSRDSASVRTGGDGTVAHALERVFGALNAAAKANMYVIERMSAKQRDYQIIPLGKHAAASHHITQWRDSQEVLLRHKDMEKCYRAIVGSACFDSDYYAARYPDMQVSGMDPLVHYILYGDILGLNPSEVFCTNFYLLARKDVEKAGICSLYHFVRYGCREGVVTNPAPSDWLCLAKRLGFFSEKWYESEYPDANELGLSGAEHYALVGRHLNRSTSANFDPASIPSMWGKSIVGFKESALEFYLKNLLREELSCHELMNRSSAHGDYVLIDYLATYFKARFGYTSALREAMGTRSLLRYDWRRARTEWLDYWHGARAGGGARCGRSALVFDGVVRVDACPYEDEVHGHIRGCRAAGLGRPSSRVCVYTTLFGGIDDLLPVIDPVPGVDYICFTDRKREARGWRQVVVDPGMGSENLKAKIFKILPHRYLQDYDYSMFVDANTILIGRIGELIDTCLNAGDFVMWRHPFRDDVYLEACAIISHRRHEPAAIISQVESYHRSGLPRHTGLYEASFIWRRHGAEPVVRFMELWWAEILNYSSRDQLSLAYLAWREDRRPKVLSSTLGTSRANVYFEKIPHRNHRGGSGPAGTRGCKPVGKRSIAFLYAAQYQNTGSTILRSQQLSDVVRSLYEGDRDICYTDSLDIRDSIVILSKGFMKAHDPEVIRTLSRANVVVADFVDDPVNAELLDEIDVIMASSLTGYKDYLSRYGHKAIAHVTHHVDTRIGAQSKCAMDRFSAGYFGELVNTIATRAIEELVSFNLVDTSRQTLDWMGQLRQFNFHYAVRRSRRIDGAKPFLKGFVAAHCGANMLIQKGAGDARYYLGNDYPFLVADDVDELGILEQLRRAKGLFGGREWAYGLEIMEEVKARSSLRKVQEEFAAMIETL